MSLLTKWKESNGDTPPNIVFLISHSQSLAKNVLSADGFQTKSLEFQDSSMVGFHMAILKSGTDRYNKHIALQRWGKIRRLAGQNLSLSGRMVSFQVLYALLALQCGQPTTYGYNFDLLW